MILGEVMLAHVQLELICSSFSGWMFIALLFITAETRKQPRCPSVGEWLNQLWYFYTMEYYST